MSLADLRILYHQAETFAESALESPEMGDGSGAATGLGAMFSEPNLIAKLAGNPRTQKYLSDPAFMNTVRNLRRSARANLFIFSFMNFVYSFCSFRRIPS